MQRLRYVPALDGLRGVAIALVVAFHYFGFPPGGTDGVDLFFVLSGFLITTLLLEERAETGTVRLRGFYARRIRRLIPALLSLLAAFSVIAAVKGVDPLPQLARFGFYTGNFTRAYFDPHGRSASSGISHLWSLAEEEQFYLVWPLLLLLVARTRRLLLLTTLFACALIAYRGALVLDGASLVRLFYGPDTRADGLMLGAILAIARQRGVVRIPEGLVPWLLAVFTIAVAIPAGFSGWPLVVLPVFELVCVGLIAATVGGSSLAGPLAWRPLVFLGKISYSLYLWHYMIWWMLGWQHPWLALAISLTCSCLSYRFVEQPFRRGRPSISTTSPLRAPTPVVGDLIT